MDRGWILDVLNLAARDGRDVLVVHQRQELARTALADVAEAATAGPYTPTRVTMGNGHEGMTFPSGGRIRFVGTNHRMRGQTADVVVLLGIDAFNSAGYDCYVNACLVVAGSQAGRVIAYAAAE